jgi:uncharacterized protein YdcH (DUF465 family)
VPKPWQAFVDKALQELKKKKLQLKCDPIS